MTNQHLDALPIGFELQHYKIEKVLGQGTFGITYLASDTKLQQLVAIKEYLPTELSSRDNTNTVHPKSKLCEENFEDGIKRFLAEARTLAKFKHPNIVRVNTFFEANHTAYMVMEYEEGQDLATLLKERQTLAEEEIRKIFIPLLEGLQAVHAKGVVHRDIKPSNIFLRKNGSPVLLDFGAARHKSGDELFTTLVTPGYAPYENYHSDSEKQGPWSDLYSLGAVAYRSVTGKAPIDSSQRSAALVNKQPDPLTPAVKLGRKRYSENFLRAIDHALAIVEKDRPQNVADWLKELQTSAPVFKRQPSTPNLKIATLTCASVFVISLLYLALFPSPTEKTTILQIESAPQGATVWLDDIELGTTPFYSEEILTGSYHLKVLLKYYQPFSEKIILHANQVTNKEINFKKGRGSLTFLSTPPKALLYLDKKEIPQRTPTTLTEIEAGMHQIRVRADWYQDKIVEVEVLPGKTSKINTVLKKLPPQQIQLDPVTGMEFVWIPEGCFQMGSKNSEKDRITNEGPVHEVCLDGFLLGKTEVTQAQWLQVMKSNPSASEQGDTYPVESVSWNMVNTFIDKLTAMNNGKYKFRLPTEAEWEYSCRAGTTTPFYFGETIDNDQVNFKNSNGRTSDLQTVPVGSYPPNSFGLYDMHGNVWEWCADHYDEKFYRTKEAKKKNPLCRTPSSTRVLRGGAWFNGPDYIYLRCASRIEGETNNLYVVGNGFRLVREEKE